MKKEIEIVKTEDMFKVGRPLEDVLTILCPKDCTELRFVLLVFDKNSPYLLDGGNIQTLRTKFPLFGDEHYIRLLRR